MSSRNWRCLVGERERNALLEKCNEGCYVFVNDALGIAASRHNCEAGRKIAVSNSEGKCLGTYDLNSKNYTGSRELIQDLTAKRYLIERGNLPSDFKEGLLKIIEH